MPNTRTQLEQLARRLGYTPEQDDTDEDLRLVIRNRS